MSLAFSSTRKNFVCFVFSFVAFAVNQFSLLLNAGVIVSRAYKLFRQFPFQFLTLAWHNAQLNSGCTHPACCLLPAARLLSTLNNEAIFALNSHTQAITSELRLSTLRSKRTEERMEGIQHSVWLTMPKWAAFFSLESRTLHEINGKMEEPLWRAHALAFYLHLWHLQLSS